MTKLEKAANVAVIVACGALVVSLARNYYLSRRSDPGVMPEIQKGTMVKLPGADPGNQQAGAPTLVLALSKNCRFCQESVGFYQRLAAFKRDSLRGVRLVAVLPESKEEAESYLREQGIAVDAVLSAPVSEIGVSGTPTLLLLDRQNKLEEMWIGKLNDAQETQVLTRLKKVEGS
jgi:hypothetical protein